MTPHKMMAAGLVQVACQLGERHGIPRAELLYVAALEPEEISDPDARIPAAAVEELLRYLSFQRLLEEVRHARAVKYLTETNDAIELVAERLGYADPSNFRRAFRRWTGQPPAVFRAGQRAAFDGSAAAARRAAAAPDDVILACSGVDDGALGGAFSNEPFFFSNPQWHVLPSVLTCSPCADLMTLSE